MPKFAVVLYPDFSLQEITCLTSVLSVWFGEKIDFITSGAQEMTSEEGLAARPTKTTAEAKVTDYDCVILAAISSAPILLSKAGILRGRKFTAGYFMQMAETFDFVEKENFIHKGIIEDGNVITGIGMFFREFAEAVLRRFDYDIGEELMRDKPEDFTEEDLTFRWSDEDYREFLEELKEYTGEV